MAGRQIAIPVASTEKLSLWQKIGYGLGDIYGGGTAALVSFYYLIFLTDVIRLNPALAGTVILISKVYDAFTDPFEGVISDRTRLGRRRPYLLAGIPLIFLSFLPFSTRWISRRKSSALSSSSAPICFTQR